MLIDLKYGIGKLTAHIPDDQVRTVLEPGNTPALPNPTAEVTHLLREPIGGKPLRQIVQEKIPQKVVIIVNDITRSTPFALILPPILEELHTAGVQQDQISFVIATGIHPPHTPEQNLQVFGAEMLHKYTFTSHNPDRNLVNLGTLSTGHPLDINREVASADLLITTGVIILHYIAGFSGGRKSILPGVAGRTTIELNHAAMLNMVGKNVPLAENTVHQEMIEAAQMVGVDFTVNVVMNGEQEIVKVVAGDLGTAWETGIQLAEKIYRQTVNERTDVTIVSAGGDPKDMNVYQAQKALHNADLVTKDGGLIILLAECRQGLGDPVFATWMREAKTPEDNLQRIHREFIIGGHKAFAISQVAAKKEIILISTLDRATTEMLFFKKYTTVEEALAYARKKFGEHFTINVLPHGGLVHPQINEVNAARLSEVDST